MIKKKITIPWLTSAAAFLIPAILWIMALAIFGMYPFGERSILITDMGQQYIEFHAALYDAVHSGSSLLYTWNTGLGMNFVGLFAYYLASPFTLLLFLFPRTALTEAVLFIISMKIAAAGLTFSIFLRRAAKVHGAINVLFATLYALSAYPVVYCFSIMWLDAVVLLPLDILAVKHCINKQKAAPLVAVLFVLFISNFYTAYMVGLFSLLVFIGMLWIKSCPFRKCVHTAGIFLGSAALAAGLAAFLLLPTYLALRDCQGTITNRLPISGFITDPLTLLGKLMFGAYDSITNYGTPNLYCGVLSFGMLPVWLVHGSITKREKIAGSTLIVTLLICMLIKPLNILWHACESPVWFPCRYSFVFIFVILTCAARALSRRDGLTPRRVITGFGASFIVAFAIGCTQLLFPHICKTLTGNIWITLGALIAYSLLVLFWRTRNSCWIRRVGLIALTIMVSTELTCNTQIMFTHLDKELRFEKRESYAAFTKRNQYLKASLNNYTLSKDDSLTESNFYRVENFNARNANDGMSGGYPALSHYSSLSRRDTFGFLKNCGMVCTSYNKIFRYYGSTSALDAILGVRYIYSPNELRSGYLFTGIERQGLSLYTNKYALPLAYFADKAVMEIPSKEKAPFKMLNTFLSSLRGQPQQYYKPLSVESSCNRGTLRHFKTRTRIYAQKKAELCFTIHNSRQQHVLLYLNNNIKEITPVYINGKKLNPRGERLIRGIIDLGEQPEGDVIVTLHVTGKTRWFSGLCAATFDETAFSQLISTLRQHVPKELNVTTNNAGEPLITGCFTAPRDGVLFTSIPADKSWEATVDGKKVTPSATQNAFLTIPVTQGEHKFTLHFRPRGLTAGILISISFALLCIVLWFMRKRKPIHNIET